MSIDKLKKYTTVEVSRWYKNDYYVSSVQEMNDQEIYITLPVFMSQPLILERGEKIKVRFLGKDEYFVFDSTVKDIINDSCFLYCIVRTASVERVQQRRFVRFVTLKPIFFANIPENNNKPQYFEGNSLDISGGGMKLLINKLYEIGNELLLKFTITNSKGAYKEVEAKVRVVRKGVPQPGQTKYHILGVEFVDLHEELRSQIISFVFREMARVRRNLGR